MQRYERATVERNHVQCNSLFRGGEEGPARKRGGVVRCRAGGLTLRSLARYSQRRGLGLDPCGEDIIVALSSLAVVQMLMLEGAQAVYRSGEVTRSCRTTLFGVTAANTSESLSPPGRPDGARRRVCATGPL